MILIFKLHVYVPSLYVLILNFKDTPLNFSIISNPHEGLADENLVSVYKIFVIFCSKTFFAFFHINVM